MTDDEILNSKDYQAFQSLKYNSLYCISELMQHLQSIDSEQSFFNDIYSEYEDENREIFVFILVTDDHLFNCLKKEGEICFEYHGLNVWGRTTFGQSVWSDSVMIDIYRDYYKVYEV